MDGVTFKPTIFTNPKNRHYRNPEVKPEVYMLLKLAEKE